MSYEINKKVSGQFNFEKFMRETKLKYTALRTLSGENKPQGHF